MQLALTDEQRMIQQSAERFLAQVASSEAVRSAMASERGQDPHTWAQIAQELYWPALAIPELYGGLGLGFAEVCLLQGQLGRCLLPSAFYATCCLALPALLLSRNYAACIADACLNIDAEPHVREQLAEAAATAKIHASEGFFKCAGESIQLHGGVGFTWEYDPHLYFKRARASEQLWGSPAFHREQLARQIFGEQA